MEFPAGAYYIGDPCYVFNYDTWDKLVKQMTKKPPTEVAELDGHKMWYHSTAYGDGLFVGSDGNQYGVDSGTIGVVPLDMTDGEKLKEVKDLGNIRAFKEPFKASFKDGTFTIGNIEIKTG